MESAKATVHRTLTQVKAFLAQEAPPKLSEANTKANFIEPIISALGWVGIGVVTREYYVKNSQEFIDYVMTGPDGLLLAIESKSMQSDLTDKAAAQLIQYCSVEGIEWAVLTNGRELQFFNTFLRPDLSAKRVLSLDLLAFNSDEEYEALFQQIWQLSRESMTTPTGVRNWLNQRRLDAGLRGILLNPSSPSVKHLRKALADAEIKTTPQELAQWFRSHLTTPITVLPGPVKRLNGAAQGPSSPLPGQGVGHKLDDDGEGGAAFDASQSDTFTGTRRSLLPLFQTLRRSMNQRSPQIAWRAAKYYVAAQSGDQTFLAVKCRSQQLVLGLTLPAELVHPRVSDNVGEFNWARMTKIARVLSDAGIDDALLDLIDAAQEHARIAARGSRYYGVTLRQLLDGRWLEPGTALVLVAKGRRDVATGTLSLLGEIIWQGQSYRSPSDRAFAPLLGLTHFNGWTHWFAELPHGRESLADVRAKMLNDPGAENESAETGGA